MLYCSMSGDGFDDLVLGAPNGESGNTGDFGQISVIFGTDAAQDGAFDIDTLNGSNGFNVFGGRVGDEFGEDIAFGQDFNLYVAPPAHAVVLSIDEKSQIQALDCTQPGLPLKIGRGATLTQDYKRNGTTTLFAALNVLEGTVIGQNMARHRHQEFIRFLNQIERDVQIIHVILDNYAAHKHAKVRAWLVRHPRWTFHFIPTSSSWLNAPSRRMKACACLAVVEGFFAKLTRRRLKYGVFHSIVDLQAAINHFIDEHNRTEAKPFNWTADPDKIIAARNRGFQRLDSIH